MPPNGPQRPDTLIALRYHESTKHHFNRFARSLGYLDWASQPDPFRRYAGAPLVELARGPLAGGVAYPALFDRTVPPVPFSDASIAEFLRCSMGLSAWKQHQRTRWALRVNPSSGNLHPTEAYAVRDGRVCHYAPREHAFEERSALPADAWSAFAAGRPGLLVALTSILWREAWKYGERAFRYCQHDAGHAIGALRIAAATLGWSALVLKGVADDTIEALLGLDRAADFDSAERESAEVVMALWPGEAAASHSGLDAQAVNELKRGCWYGKANRLTRDDPVRWEIIDTVSQAARKP